MLETVTVLGALLGDMERYYGDGKFSLDTEGGNKGEKNTPEKDEKCYVPTSRPGTLLDYSL